MGLPFDPPRCWRRFFLGEASLLVVSASGGFLNHFSSVPIRPSVGLQDRVGSVPGTNHSEYGDVHWVHESSPFSSQISTEIRRSECGRRFVEGGSAVTNSLNATALSGSFVG